MKHSTLPSPCVAYFKACPDYFDFLKILQMVDKMIIDLQINFLIQILNYTGNLKHIVQAKSNRA